jgi:hypothetical protein
MTLLLNKEFMTEEQKIWINWYYDATEFVLRGKPNIQSLPKLSLDEKISLIEPSFNEIAEKLPETHAKWLKWYKFGNINKIIHEYKQIQEYEQEPELTISFSEKYQILENERIRQYKKVCLLLDEKKFIEPYIGEEKEIRLKVKKDILQESLKNRYVFPNRDCILSGIYNDYFYRIENNHKEILHPEYIVMKILYNNYLKKSSTSFTEAFDEFYNRIQYERTCSLFKRSHIDVEEEDVEEEDVEEE